MANYRFKTAEIEAMKKNILTHIEHETETKTAWRLRCAIEGQLMCCRPSKREAARLERELALYERLTKNDLPNWQSKPIQPSTPAETPRISKETAETVNVSAEGEKEDKPRKIDQIKIRRVYGDMFCVSMYVDGKLVDCENGITESQKDKIQNLFDNGKLFASIQPPQSTETPKMGECTAESCKLAQTA